MARSWYTAADAAEIRELLGGGGRVRDVADRFGVSWGTARRAAHALGVRLHHGGQYNVDLRVMVLGYLSRGPAACREIGRAMTPPRCREAVLRIVRQLERDGLVRRTGRTKGIKYHVTRKWSHDDASSEA